ncbi:MAG: peptidylprolyl isomerase [Thermomicrobiales bacterium]
MTDRGPGSRKQRANDKRGTKLPQSAADRPRRVSRREKEAKRQKLIRYGIGLAAAAVIAVLLGFAVNEYIVKPRAVLATVEGTRIRREDYWRYRSMDLYNQVVTYQQYSTYVTDSSQQQQYLALAQQAQANLKDVWGSTSVDDATLQQMIENQIYLNSLDELGITISDEEVKTWANNQFAPSDAPLIPPTPSPTFIPERAAWATGTADALIPTPTPTQVPASPAAGTPSAATPQATPIVGTPEASPAAASPQASPAASTPIPTVTPDPAQALQTAEAGFDSYKDSVFGEVHMSEGDYLRLWAKPQVAKQKVRDVLIKDIGQTADQVHAEHILVATEDLANQIYADVTTGGQNFEEVAKAKSTDTSTAPNGGDLGWFPHGVMVQSFEDAAFAGQPGQILAPIQTQFGWHIIKVIDVQPNRALTDEQITQLQDDTVSNWLKDQEASMKISSKIDPTPTPVSETFEPPVDAPAVSTVTPTVEASPAASPVANATPTLATPEASPLVATPDVTTQAAATPVPASPIATTEATPVASPVVAPGASGTSTATPVVESSTPAASPAASPMASPIASPVTTPIMNPLGTPSS